MLLKSYVVTGNMEEQNIARAFVRAALCEMDEKQLLCAVKFLVRGS